MKRLQSFLKKALCSLVISCFTEDKINGVSLIIFYINYEKSGFDIIISFDYFYERTNLQVSRAAPR